MTKIGKSFYPITLFGLGLVFLAACQKFEPEGFLYFTTDQAVDLGGGNYQLYASVEDLGGADITQHGFCWSESANPTLSGPSSQLGPRKSTGTFSSTVSGLQANTTFFFRAYVTTGTGTEYAKEKTFVTEASQPAVTTKTIDQITETSARGGGNVTDDGGAAVSSRGICWDTTENPTTLNSSTSDGAGTGTFMSDMAGLLCGTTYYVRAYATNASGTSYGAQVSFTTAACTMPAIVNTSSVGSIGENAAQCGGDVTSEGGGTVSLRGVCWSTSPNPTTSNHISKDGSGPGSFTSNLTGLRPYTTYYVRAYAVNNAGTAYGNEVVFRTRWDNSDISDYDKNIYKTIQIGDQVWMRDNLKTTHYADGTAIPLVESDIAWNALGISGKGYCWYDNKSENKDTYGGLYNWAAVMNGRKSSNAVPSGVQGVCPDDWHVPSDSEWKQMEQSLGMSRTESDGLGWRGKSEGGSLKYDGAIWSNPNTGATNTSGFSAIPGGWRHEGGLFSDLRLYAVFWTATAYDVDNGVHRNLQNDHADVYRFYYPKNGGFTIRCVMDE